MGSSHGAEESERTLFVAGQAEKKGGESRKAQQPRGSVGSVVRSSSGGGGAAFANVYLLVKCDMSQRIRHSLAQLPQQPQPWKNGIPLKCRSNKYKSLSEVKHRAHSELTVSLAAPAKQPKSILPSQDRPASGVSVHGEIVTAIPARPL